jgi:hypothetical protein
MQRITNSSCRFSTVSLVILFIVLFFCTGCNTTKYLSEDQSFYGGSRIKFKPVQKGIGGKGELEKDLEALITPKPNTKVFGVRPGVWFYFRQRDAKKKKGFKAWIRKKFGQAPVLITDVEPERTAAMLTGQLQNDGYFKSDVEYVVKEKKKESIVIYTVKLYPPYRLKNINYPKGKDSTYARILRTLKKKSLLEPKQRYDLARLQAEQQRIETAVFRRSLPDL